MYTRCSSCNTHFKVTVQQLQACGGQVRCGRCTTVFDAFATLTARTPGKAEEPPPLERMDRRGWDNATAEESTLAVASAAPHAVQDVAPATTFQTEPEHSPAQQAAMALARMAEGIAMPAAMPSAAGTQANVETLTLPEDLFAPTTSRKLRGPAWAWSAAGGLLVALALLQLVFFFRGSLATSFPAARPLLLAMCKPFSCEVPLPRFPESLFIESSDLQVVDTTRPQEVLLTASVRNRAERMQAYPAVELTLTDTMDHPMAKRLFLPKDYLPAGLAEEQGFAAGAEVSIKLLLNTGDLRAAGYRLYLFFPG